MSFTGAGPLGSYAWGTTAQQALVNQVNDVKDKFNKIKEVISSPPSNYPTQEFPELGSKNKPDTNILNLNSQKSIPVWPAAIFTANEVENLEDKIRMEIAQRKKEFSDQPKDIVDATEKFRKEQLESLQRRHAAIGN